jgi:hypothetical protein
VSFRWVSQLVRIEEADVTKLQHLTGDRTIIHEIARLPPCGRELLVRQILAGQTLNTIGQVMDTLDGPINREAFVAYIEQVLVHDLKPVTLSSWTTCQATKAIKSVRLSKPWCVPALSAALQP